MSEAKSKTPWPLRILKILGKTLLFLLLFILLLILLIQTPPAQRFIRKKAVAYLENKLHTRVSLDKLYISLAGEVVLTNLYAEDQQQDTLLSAGELAVSINPWKLLHSKIAFSSIYLSQANINIYRQLPDTSFNFQFIIDAFSSGAGSDQASKDTSAANPISVGSLALDSIRVRYNDVVSGIDFQGRLSRFELDDLLFDSEHHLIELDRSLVSGLNASFRQQAPLVKTIPAGNEKASPFQLKPGTTDLHAINFKYNDQTAGLDGIFEIGDASLQTHLIDMAAQTIAVGSLDLRRSYANIQSQPTAHSSPTSGDTSARSPGWQITAGRVTLWNNRFQMDDLSRPSVPQAMDYAHLKLKDISLGLQNFEFRDGSLSGQIDSASLNSNNQFRLRQLKTTFAYDDHGAALENLELKTDRSSIATSAKISYPDLEALAKNPEQLGIDLNMEKSSLSVADLLYFVPGLKDQPLFADPNDLIIASGRASGRLGNLQIDHIAAAYPPDAVAELSGRISGLPDLRKLAADVQIQKISASAETLRKWLPPGTLPPGWTGPAELSGSLKGRYSALRTDLKIRLNQGYLHLAGTAGNFLDSLAATYDLAAETRQLNLAELLSDSSLPSSLTATLKASGKGYEPESMQSEFSAGIQHITYNRYDYSPLMINGSIDKGLLSAKMQMNDPNLSFRFSGSTRLAHLEEGLQARLQIDSVKTLPLHLGQADLAYHGLLTADFSNADPDQLNGEAVISESQIVLNGRRVKADSVVFKAEHGSAGNHLSLTSNFAVADMQGRFNVSELGRIFADALQPYFATRTGDSLSKHPDYDFEATVGLYESPVWTVFVPGLTAFDSARLQADLHGPDNWQASLSVPRLDINGNQIRDLLLNASTGNRNLAVKTNIGLFSSGGTTLLYHSSLDADISNNIIDAELTARDGADKTRYHLLTRIKQPEPGHYVFSIHPEKLMLNYDNWTMTSDNKVDLAQNGIRVEHLVLERRQQSLSIQSKGTDFDSPINVSLSAFRLGTITAFIKSDTTLADGLIDGNLEVRDPLGELSFSGKLKINELSVYGDTLGMAQISIDRQNGNRYATDISINGRGNDLQLAGTYQMNPGAQGQADLKLDLNRLPMTTIEAFSFGAVKAYTGYLNGAFAITGSIDAPRIDGNMHFNQTAFSVNLLNSYFKVDDQNLRISENGIHFNQFTVRDSSNNQLVLDGNAHSSDYKHYDFDLHARARNFQALNSTKKDNQLFYGKLFFNCDLDINGSSDAPKADGRLTVNENTDMTIVLPQEDPGVVDREGIVQFVDMDASARDSLFYQEVDTLKTVSLHGMDISVNIEVDKKAQFKLVVDQGNGDYIQAKGEASLSGGVDPSGKVTLTGSYELEEGVYDLTFNFIHRKFKIDKGSKIIWAGDPTDADVDITATYIANTAPLDLVKNQLDPNLSAAERNTYLQKLPFEVNLIMKGKLLEPDIHFDILLPEDKNYGVSNEIINNVESKLTVLRGEEAEMNKQVFSLLLLNRFMGDNPFNSSGSSPTAGTLARQSASKLLTEQLNRVAEDLIAGVDLNFDIESSEDYTTGERVDRTDLNVDVSKKLLNDRLTVTVGSNFELEGPKNTGHQPSNIAGDITIDYRLSKDGRYMLRAYRKNEYEGEIDGYLIETGIGFVITLDYNRFRQLFLSKAAKERKRAERKKEKKASRNKKNETGQ